MVRTTVIRISGLLVLVVMMGQAGCGGSTVGPEPPVVQPPVVQPPVVQPPVAAALSALSLASSSVVGGNSVTGTVTLTSAAPTGGAAVSLSSSIASAVVPPTATVAAGETSVNFQITTTAVDDARDATITATFSGVSRTATLRVTSTPLVARFSVVSASRGNNACALSNNGNTIDCSLDGRASTGNIREWQWKYFVGSKSGSNNSREAVTRPETGCGFFGGQQETESGGVKFIQMEVELVVQDARGVTSEVASNRNIRLFPNGTCGYGF